MFATEFIDPTLRDFFITNDGLIFSVADYFHPPEGIRSVLRYIPDNAGVRFRNESQTAYKKADFDDSFLFLKENYPDWVFDVAVVPRSEIKQILKPNDAVSALLSGYKEFPAAKELVRRFEEAGIPAAAMGISGSVLAGVENEESDIDFAVYGEDWKKAHSALIEMKAKNETENEKINEKKNENSFEIRELDEKMWRKVYDKRKSPLSFEDFLAHELRKGMRGMMIEAKTGKKTYFDLLFIRSPDQIKTPIQRGKDTIKAEIEAVVVNADFSFDNPAIYLIDHAEISEIYSYTHTYAGQARSGEKIKARGMIEEIGTKKRLVIGTSREAADEWIISLTLLEKQHEN